MRENVTIEYHSILHTTLIFAAKKAKKITILNYKIKI